MYTLNYHFKKLSVTPWLTAFQKSQVRYRLPESALLSCKEQTLFHLPSGLILIPKDSHTSVFKREGSSARIKDITLDMTHDKSSKTEPPVCFSTSYEFIIGFSESREFIIPGLVSMFFGTALSGRGIFKRETARLFKELEV